jgi:hypothetical protein
MRTHIAHLIIATAFFCTMGHSASAATPLGPVSFSGGCTPSDLINRGPLSDTCSTLDITPDGTFTTHSEIRFVPAGGGAFAEADASDDEVSSQASGTYQYLVKVVGPGLDAPGPLPQVVIDVASEGSTSGSAEAQLTGDVPGHYVCSGGACQGIAPNAWTASDSFQWSAGIPFDVTMIVDADAGLGAPLNSTATIDPIFTIDPSTPNASQWSFEFSDGVTNGTVGAIPEPTTWMMMLMGFVFIGWICATYRRSDRSSSDLMSR